MSDDVLNKILAEFEKLKGQQVITGWDKVERLIAIGDDGEDWYYVCWDGKQTTWHSCLLHLIPLKGYIKKSDYDMLVRMAKINHYDSPELFGAKETRFDIAQLNKQAKEEAETLSKNCKYLTPVCWDIN